MQKWEYRRLVCSLEAMGIRKGRVWVVAMPDGSQRPYSEILTTMNEYGAQGWELVVTQGFVTPAIGSGSSTDTYVMTFKRPI